MRRATGAPAPLPQPPTLRGALRDSISDFYFNSWRLVPANLLWGLGLARRLPGRLIWWPLALVLAPLLCLPLVTMHRIGGRIVRGGDVSLSDGLRAWREVGVAAVVVGASRSSPLRSMLANLIGGLQSARLPRHGVRDAGRLGPDHRLDLAVRLLADPRRSRPRGRTAFAERAPGRVPGARAPACASASLAVLLLVARTSRARSCSRRS